MRTGLTDADCLSYGLIVPGFDEAADSQPVDPVLRLLSDPIVDSASSMMELVVNSYDDRHPYDIYLGPHGPLPYSAWRSTSSTSNGKNAATSAATWIGGQGVAAQPARAVTSNFPASRPHAILAVHLPDIQQLLSFVEKVETADTSSPSARPLDRSEVAEDIGGSSWEDPDQIDSGEMTIQEALRNAEDALHRGLGLEDFSTLPVLATSDLPASVDDPRTPVLVNATDPDDHIEEATLAMSSMKEKSGQSGNRLPILFIRQSDGVGVAPGWQIELARDGDLTGKQCLAFPSS
jgi:hypothetical protein